MNSLIELTQTVLLTPGRLLAQVEYSYSSSTQGQAPGPLFWICWLAFAILMIAACWKIFSKVSLAGPRLSRFITGTFCAKSLAGLVGGLS